MGVKYAGKVVILMVRSVVRRDDESAYESSIRRLSRELRECYEQLQDALTNRVRQELAIRFSEISAELSNAERHFHAIPAKRREDIRGRVHKELHESSRRDS